MLDYIRILVPQFNSNGSERSESPNKTTKQPKKHIKSANSRTRKNYLTLPRTTENQFKSSAHLVSLEADFHLYRRLAKKAGAK